MSAGLIPNALEKAMKWISRNRAGIGTGLGIGGFYLSIALTVKATPKAMYLMVEEEEKSDVSLKERPLDVVKLTWKEYIPAAITAGLSTGCIIAAQVSNQRAIGALSAAYTLSENTIREYQAKVKEVIGERRETEIRDQIAADRLAAKPTDHSVIFTGDGEVLCFDAYSGREFRSSKNKIEKVQNELNRRLIDENFVSLNDVYYELSLPSTKGGDDLGWNVGYEGMIDFVFSAQLNEEGEPELVLDYRVGPRADFRNLH